MKHIRLSFSHRLTWVAILLALTTSVSASELLIETFMVQQRLASEVAMYVGDPTARNTLTAVQGHAERLEGLWRRIMEENAPAAGKLRAAWEKQRSSLYEEGILKRGYNARSHIMFIAAQGEVSAILRSLIPDRRTKTSILAGVEIGHTTANYLLFSTSPTGTFDMSANNDGANFVLKVHAIDALLEKLVRENERSGSEMETLKSIKTRWVFLRSALLKAETQSVPFIVNRFGASLVSSLMAL